MTSRAPEGSSPRRMFGDYVPVAVEPYALQVVVRGGFQTKEVLRIRLNEVLVVVDGGRDEYPLAVCGVRDGREERDWIDEIAFNPQVSDAEQGGQATDELGGLRVAEIFGHLVHVHAWLIEDFIESGERYSWP